MDAIISLTISQETSPYLVDYINSINGYSGDPKDFIDDTKNGDF